MKLSVYQIDTFTQKVFSGNPAAVCPLDEWIDDSLLQAIAQENNLPETAFFVKNSHKYSLRWFTPACEVDLCGHATLATAFVIYTILKQREDTILFKTKSGALRVKKQGKRYVMDFPATPPKACLPPGDLVDGLGGNPIEILSSNDYLAVFNNEEDILALTPDFSLLKKLPLRGVIATAKGKQVDFVCRFFGPKVGINEDPVTGSAHCTLAPYWARHLKKDSFTAKQLSKRGGELFCSLYGDRITISGYAVLVMEGTITF